MIGGRGGKPDSVFVSGFRREENPKMPFSLRSGAWARTPQKSPSCPSYSLPSPCFCLCVCGFNKATHTHTDRQTTRQTERDHPVLEALKWLPTWAQIGINRFEENLLAAPRSGWIYSRQQPAPLDPPGRERGGRGYGGFISKLAGGRRGEAASNHKIFQKTPWKTLCNHSSFFTASVRLTFAEDVRKMGFQCVLAPPGYHSLFGKFEFHT